MKWQRSRANLGKFGVNKLIRQRRIHVAGGLDMKQFCGAIALGAALIGALAGSAIAAPPTVVPSPGYDARLQEQRAASQRVEPPKPAYDPAPRRKPRPHHSVPR
jgi:hypothetical protein